MWKIFKKQTTLPFIIGLLFPFLFILCYKTFELVQYFHWQSQRRTLLQQLLEVDEPNSYQMKNITILEEKEIDTGLVRKKIEFIDVFGDRTPCYFFENIGKQLPGVVIVPGHGGGINHTAGLMESYENNNALELASTGEYQVITCENKEEGVLKTGKSTSELHKEYDSKNSYMSLVLPTHLAALNFLYQQDLVISSQLGMAGMSLGAEVAMYVAAIDTRVKSVIVMGWLTNWTELIDDNPDWKVPQLDQHFLTMANIGDLIIPRYSLYHNGSAEGISVVGVGFPADVARVLAADIHDRYTTMLVPSRIVFASEDVEHVYVNDLGIKYFDTTIGKYSQNWITTWLIKDLPELLHKFIQPIIGSFYAQ